MKIIQPCILNSAHNNEALVMLPPSEEKTIQKSRIPKDQDRISLLDTFHSPHLSNSEELQLTRLLFPPRSMNVLWDKVTEGPPVQHIILKTC